MALSNSRIVITGCSGGGKSTLLEALAARGHAVMPEPGRIIVKQELEGDGSALPWVDMEKFARRAIEIGNRFHADTARSAGPAFFDRSILDATAALERLQLAPAAEFNELLANTRYAPNVFIAPPWPEIFAADKERQLGFEQALAEYEYLTRYYPAHGYRLTELPKVPVGERVEFVEEQVRRWRSAN